MTLDRALELAEAALHEERLEAMRFQQGRRFVELEEALKAISELRNETRGVR